METFIRWSETQMNMCQKCSSMNGHSRLALTVNQSSPISFRARQKSRPSASHPDADGSLSPQWKTHNALMNLHREAVSVSAKLLFKDESWEGWRSGFGWRVAHLKPTKCHFPIPNRVVKLTKTHRTWAFACVLYKYGTNREAIAVQLISHQAGTAGPDAS